MWRLACCLIVCMLPSIVAAESTGTAARPNVVFILTDDLAEPERTRELYSMLVAWSERVDAQMPKKFRNPPAPEERAP